MGRRILSLLLALTAGVGLAACGQAPSPAEGQEARPRSPEQRPSDRLRPPRPRGTPWPRRPPCWQRPWGPTWWRWARRGTSPPVTTSLSSWALPQRTMQRRRRWRPSWTPMTLGPGPSTPSSWGRGTTRLPSSAALSQHQPGALLGSRPSSSPRRRRRRPSPSGPSPCPCAMGVLPRKGARETPWPPPR